MMEAEAIQQIVKLTDDPEIEIGERHYTVRNLRPIEEPRAPTLPFRTLTGLVDYIRSGIDKPNLTEHVLHVAQPSVVGLLSELHPLDRKREFLAGAELQEEGFPFDEWQDQENALIGIQTLFVDTTQRAALLKALGTMTADEIQTHMDDGVTQRVTAAAGVALADRRDLPSPISLAPFRTFREVDQPESLFVVRVRKQGERLAVALFEADGGAWKLEAVKRVAAWLREAVPEELKVLA
jgi:hypothetical protein